MVSSDKQNTASPSHGHDEDKSAVDDGTEQEASEEFHCHSSCSEKCSSCYKMTRSGMKYGTRCLCIEPATPTPTPKKMFWKFKRFWLLVLLFVLFSVWLGVMIHQDIINPVRITKNCYHVVAGYTKTVLQVQLRVIVIVLRVILWPFIAVKEGVDTVRGVVRPPTKKDLVKPAKYTEKQVMGFQNLNKRMLAKLYGASKEVTETSKTMVKEPKVEEIPGKIKDQKFLLTKSKDYAFTKLMFWKKEKKIEEPGSYARHFLRTKNLAMHKHAYPLIVVLGCLGIINSLITLRILFEFWMHYVEDIVE